MKLENFVKKYNGHAIEDDGAYASEDFKKFAKAFRATLKAEMESIGAEIVSYSVGHYFVSAFVKKDEKYIYISYDCPRYGQPIDFSRSGATIARIQMFNGVTEQDFYIAQNGTDTINQKM